MISALIFDCDGTLTNSMPLHFLAWSRTMERHGLALAEERFYSLAGMPTEKIISLLAGEQGVCVDIDCAAREKEQAFVDSLHLLQPIPAVLQIAREQRGRMKMAVASGGVRPVIQRQLTQIGCWNWFDVVVTAEDTARHKPEPDVFLEAARRLDARPDQCRVYEDSDLGIEAARRAGMEWIDIRLLEEPRTQ